jgi:hypothetical protein
VREGQVAWSGASALLPTGQELTAQPGSAAVYRPIASFGADWDWVALAAAPIEIDGQPLRHLLDRLARDNGWRLRFVEADAERRAGAALLHGSVAGLTPEEVLATVLPTTELRWRVEKGVLVISRAAS